MKCGCITPIPVDCLVTCSTVATVKYVVKKGGLPFREEALALLDQLLENDFDETQDMPLITQVAEQLAELGQVDAALIMSNSVTSALGFVKALPGNTLEITEPLLQRNFDLQANIIENGGEFEIATQLRETLTGPLAKGK